MAFAGFEMADVGGRGPDAACDFLLSQIELMAPFANNLSEGTCLGPCHAQQLPQVLRASVRLIPPRNNRFLSPHASLATFLAFRSDPSPYDVLRIFFQRTDTQ